MYALTQAVTADPWPGAKSSMIVDVPFMMPIHK